MSSIIRISLSMKKLNFENPSDSVVDNDASKKWLDCNLNVLDAAIGRLEAKQQAEKTANINKLTARFGITIPKDADDIVLIEKAEAYEIYCGGAKDGTLFKFRTALNIDEVQDLFAVDSDISSWEKVIAVTT